MPEESKVHPSTVRALQRRLLEWFKYSKREFPWRGTRDPYAVLVSEIMLQQTQASTVIPYFERFMERFPNFRSLAAANEEEVFRYWAGLGYYRRARNLHRSAQEIVRRHKGRFPRRRDEILALPGIGPYTFGAVMSIAFRKPEPLVDGNVERALSRVFAIEDDLSSATGKKKLWDIASKIVPPKSPGDFNQALMELGSRICKPGNPECPQCPIQPLCRAFRNETVDRFPIKMKKQRPIKIDEVVLLMQNRNRWLIVDGNEEALFPGLWQFPWVWKGNDDTSLACSLNRIGDWLGMEVENAHPFHTAVHGVTFRNVSTHFYHLQVRSRKPMRTRKNGRPFEEARWVSAKDLFSIPLPSYQQKVVDRLPGKSP